MTLRAITVRQPWAWAIVHGQKDVENRTRNLAGGFRGLVAIHAARADADDAPDDLWIKHANHFRRTHPRWDPDKIHSERGVVIGVADLVDVHHADRNALECAERGGADTWCSLWAEPGAWHLVLANQRPLPEPVGARGHLGLWTLPEDVEAAVREQVSL